MSALGRNTRVRNALRTEYDLYDRYNHFLGLGRDFLTTDFFYSELHFFKYMYWI